MRQIIRFLAALSLLLIFGCIGFFCLSALISDPNKPIVVTVSPTSIKIPTTTRIITIVLEKGTITVPGRAYLDGRDPQAQPPLTINEINIWQEHGPGLSPLVCDKPHGHPVEVLNAERIESRYWFQVDAGDGCIGWLLDSLIGPTLEEPVGELRPSNIAP